ncbi:hypothetical protein C8R44DRAFT_891277 [Mycena epipterygia]|nr:hypothetical protein C8R44DRAFT_891277 [Mycena epipterygia]
MTGFLDLGNGDPVDASTLTLFGSVSQVTADIGAVLNISTDTILSQITALGKDVTDDVEPLINDLTAALNTGSASLTSLVPNAKRQSPDDVAALVAVIIGDIANSLDELLGTVFDGVDGLLGMGLADVHAPLN